MITSVNSSGGVGSVFSPSALQGGLDSAGRLKDREMEGSFDQVSISQSPMGQSKFHRELTSRLVQEVRTANSTGNIQRIREDIQSGSYQIDPAEIAAKMLLGGHALGNN